MRTLPLVLSLGAIGMSGFSLVVALGRSNDAHDRPTDASLEVRLAAVEQVLASRSANAAPPRERAPAPAGDGVTGPAPGGAAGGSSAPALAAGGRAPMSAADLDRRLADVEKRLREREGREASAAAQVVDAPVFQAGPTFLGSVDDAAKHLELSASQRADFERAIEDAKRDIDVIRKTQDETGMTWEKAEKETLTFQNGAISIDSGKLAAFREKVIPGRSESFGGAMRRVREDAFRRMKGTLSPEQTEKFSKAGTDGLLPGASDPFGLISFSMATPDTVVAPEPTPAMDAR